MEKKVKIGAVAWGLPGGGTYAARTARAAGLDGIQKKIYPTKASDRSLSESDQKEQGIENLPENLREAITLFEDSSWMKEILGEAFCKQYAQAKRKEWLRYSQEISDWEIEEYLYRI